MWECFRNTIQLLFLPAHTSHILQPLDLSVFSPLKTVYRRKLNKMGLFCTGSVAGKRIMLNCVAISRKEALTVYNIKPGWRATGLWPVNMAKPLMSGFLLQNSNNQDDIDELIRFQQSPATAQIAAPAVHRNARVLQTPRRKAELRVHLTHFAIRRQPLNTRRLSWRVGVVLGW